MGDSGRGERREQRKLVRGSLSMTGDVASSLHSLEGTNSKGVGSATAGINWSHSVDNTAEAQGNRTVLNEPGQMPSVPTRIVQHWLRTGHSTPPTTRKFGCPHCPAQAPARREQGGC